MDLEFVKSMIRKSSYSNETANLKGVKIPISLNLELMYPNHVKEGSVFLIITRCAIGNPVQKFDMFIEQVDSFRIINIEEGFDTSRDNMQKFISVICHPTALKEMQKAIDSLTALYQIGPIKIPTSTENLQQRPNNILDLGKGPHA